MNREYLSRKESITISSIEIIDEFGMQGLTIRSIANREKVSEAAIYRHYKSKEDILISILEKFSSFDDTVVNVVREQNMSSKDGITFYIKSYVEYYENYPAITSIILNHDFSMAFPSVQEKMDDILRIRDNFLTDLIKKGQQTGEISQNITPKGLTHTIHGLFIYTVAIWKLNKCTYSLKETLLNTLSQILNKF